MSTLVDAALSYARMGIPVFPCRDKLPLIPQWPERATCDEQQVRAWFDVRPAPQIGVVTGPRSGLWVLDVDGPIGRDTWEDYVRRNGGMGALPDALTVQTRAGMHHWYRLPEGVTIRNSAGLLGEGLDVRGAGGYVVAPPSAGYRFADYPDEDGIPLAPEWLLELVQSLVPPVPQAPSVGVDELRIPVGRRDAALTSLAGSMRRRGMGCEEIEAALQVCNERRCESPLAAAQVAKIAASVCRYAPSDVPDVLLIQDVPRDTRLATIRAIAVKAKAMRWLWPGYLPLGMLSLHAGKQGLGKSYMWCDLMARLSCGATMPDGTAHEPIDVLAVMMEDDFGYIVRPRLEAAGADLDRIHLATDVIAGTDAEGGEFRDRFRVSLHMQALRATAQELGAKLVVIDPIGAFLEGDDGGNGAGEVRRLLDPLQEMARDLDAAVCCLAHVRKGGGQDQGDPMDVVAGSHQWTAVPRVVHVMTREGDDANPTRTVTVVKSNVQRPKPVSWRLDEASEGYGELEGTTAAPVIAWDSGEVRPFPGSIAFAMRYLDAEEWRGAADILEAVRLDFPAIPERRIRSALRACTAAELAEERRSAAGKQYRQL